MSFHVILVQNVWTIFKLALENPANLGNFKVHSMSTLCEIENGDQPNAF